MWDGAVSIIRGGAGVTRHKGHGLSAGGASDGAALDIRDTHEISAFQLRGVCMTYGLTLS